MAVARRVRWYELAPELVLIAGLGVFAVTEPSAAGSAFRSARAIGLMVAVAVLWLLARAATLVVLRPPAMRLVLFGAAALVVLRIVVLPAYDDHTVVESPPAVAAAAVATGAPQAAPAAQAPVRTHSGSFRGIDHRAKGSVNLYRAPGGQVVVGLEDFEIQPGPAYALYLVRGSDRHDREGGTRLGRLRGNKGTQFYDAPGVPVEDSGAWTVLVWCETFGVPVANATPAPV